MIDANRANGSQLLLFGLDDLYNWPKMVEMAPGEKKPKQKVGPELVPAIKAGEADVTSP
jgi:hypothetical protein